MGDRYFRPDGERGFDLRGEGGQVLDHLELVFYIGRGL